MRLNRRHFLHGLFGASIALPALEAFGNEVQPDRFGLWFWGNGVRPEKWVPSGSSDWSPSEELAPLEALKDRISVLSGGNILTATHPHHSGMTGILTGRKYYQLGTTRDTIVSTFASQSVDQVAADYLSGETRLRSLELGITRFRGTDEGSTFQHLSHNGPNNPNPSEYDPVAVYRRLFEVPSDGQLDLVRRSVLDTVNGQVQDLQPRVSHQDSIRLEQHLDSIRTLENALAAELGSCGVVEEPSPYPDVNGQEQIEQKNAAMSQLLALALACDITRVFSVQFSTAGSGVVMWQVGATDGLHTVCHEQPMPQDTVHAATTFTMQQLAVFLQTLRDTPEGESNLLEACSILCTSELADGYTHANSNFPLMVAGGGNGRLRGNRHVHLNDTNAVEGTLTALWGAGVGVSSFGADEGLATSGISDFLV